MFDDRCNFLRTSYFSILSALLLGVILSGCATPIGVTLLSPQDSYRHSVENVLATGKLSDSTKAVLQRYNLLEVLADAPMQALESIHNISKTDERRGLLFALSELSYLQGTRLSTDKSVENSGKAGDLFLQSALYAYFFLLDDERGTPLTAYDKRFQVACELYNHSLWQAFPVDRDGSILFSEGIKNLIGGPLSLTIKTNDPNWNYNTFSGFFASDTFALRGFTVRNRTAGLGMPLVGIVHNSNESLNGGALPLTALLWLPGNYNDYLKGDSPAILELFSALDTVEVRLNNRLIPLKTDITTPLAYILNDPSLWTMGERRFMTGAEVPLHFLFIQPYEPGRLPVVFVHGTASSPVWWAEMANTLRADPRIRKNFQFWFYQYNSSNLVMISAAELREAISEMVTRLDPQHQDKALQNMVVIGHSQGGLLTKTTVVRSGDNLWQAISDADIDEMNMDPETKNSVRRLLFFEPVPSVKRVIFISTPHRGSYLTKHWVRSLVRDTTSITTNNLHREIFLNTEEPRYKLPESVRGKIPTSVDGMSEENQLLKELADLPLATGVVGHSIIAVKPGMDIATGNDGVVEYKSAHIEGVESEFIVRASHSSQDHPFTIEEVRRILLQHIGLGDSQ